MQPDDSALPYAPREGLDQAAYRSGRTTSVNHFHEKLFKLKSRLNTEAGRRIAEARHRFMAEYLERFLAEYAATEFSYPAYVANGPDRCCHCKADLFSHLPGFAAALPEGAVLLYGGNLDDTYDYRPGRLAARDAGARAPLAEAGLSKVDVRALSRLLGLATAQKFAQPCLSSRIP